MAKIWTTNYNSLYYRQSLTPNTATTWEEHETAGRSWDDLEAYDWDTPVVTSSETFEFPEYDVGAIHTNVSTKLIKRITGKSSDITIEWKYSDTTPIAMGYTSFVTAEYTYRYVQFRITIQNSVSTASAYLNDLNLRVDAYDITERGNNVELTAPGGATVTFSDSFGATPAITATTVGSSPYKPVITAKSKTAFTIKLYDKSDVEKSGVIDWLARGWFVAR